MPTVDGVVSGINTTSLIQAIVTARQVSIDTLKAQQNDFKLQRDGVAGVKSRMSNISAAIAEIDTATKLRAYSAKTSSSAYTVAAAAGASAGTYGLRVVSLARAELSASQGYADKTSSVVNTGTFQVTVGGVTTNVAIDAAHQSLSGLAEKLNAVAGVDAYVLDTGDPAGRYRLMVAGTETGSANAIDVNFAGVGGGPTLTEQTSAAQAQVEIGGVTVYSASNTIEGALPGVTIDLKAETAAAEDFTVGVDTAGTSARVKKVIDAYNDMMMYYRSQRAFDPANDIRGPLLSESTTRTAVDSLGRVVSSAYTVSGTTLRGLSELGVATQRDGTLTFDSAVFATKYAADPDSVDTFLTASTGPLAAIRSQIDDTMLDATNGSLVSRGASLDSTIDDLDERIAIAEERLTAETERLRAQFTAMEKALAQIQSSAASMTALFASMATPQQ